jgi:multidrug efflux system membrane fusion protein
MNEERNQEVSPDREPAEASADSKTSHSRARRRVSANGQRPAARRTTSVALVRAEPMALEPYEPTRPFGPEDPATHPPSSEPPDAKPPDGKPPKSGEHRRHAWLWIGLGILAVIGMALLFRSCGGNATTASKSGKAGAGGRGGAAGATTTITAGQTRKGSINIYVDALGTVTPVYTVTLYSQVTGQVMSVQYREGQIVKQGDLLVEIDPRPYETTLEQAEGNLEHDQGLLAEAEMDLNRYKQAAVNNAIPRQQLEDQEKIVMQDQGSVRADQGTVNYDKVQLSYTHIASPITGRVGLRLVDPGNTVFSGSSSTLAVITQLQPITVIFNVSEDDLAQVQDQLKSGRTLAVDAYDRANEKKLETGKLASLDNEIDTTTGTIKFRAEFPNKTLALFPNQFVNARLLLKTLQNVILVPTAAVQHNGTDAFVYVINPDSKVSVQKVTVLSANESETAVSGVNEGADVATSGFDRLENGVAVTVNAPNGSAAGKK